MQDKISNALTAAIDALEREIKKDPLSPERVLALTEAIKVLSGINPVKVTYDIGKVAEQLHSETSKTLVSTE